MSQERRRNTALDYFGALAGLLFLLPLAIVVGVLRRAFRRQRV